MPTHRQPSPSDAPASGRGYHEVLRVPLRWWAIATMFLASVLLAFLVALPTGIAFAATGLLVGVTFAFFVGYGGAQVTVADGILTAGRARIETRLLADPEPLDEEATRRAVGVEADARAYLLLRSYVPRSVKVRLTDPADPTPYWVVSSRHPRTLAEEIRAEIGGVSHPDHRAD